LTRSYTRRGALSLAGSAVAAGAFATSAQAQSTTLRIASFPFDVSAEVYYAQDTGIFARNGFHDVEIVKMPSGAAASAALAGGAVDFAASNILTLANAYAKAVPFTMVAPAGMYSAKAPTTALIVARNSAIQTAADLNGKIIAVDGVGGLSQFAALDWIDKNGGTSSAVKFIELAAPDALHALPEGRVAGAVMIEPFITAAQKDARILGLPFSAIAPTFLITGYAAMRPWALANPDVVRRFQTVIRQTAIWANVHHPETAAMLTKYSGLSDDLARNMTRITYAEHIDPSDVQPVIDVAVKYGNIAAFSAQQLIFTG
jgi:NitT/TauT family transport system substrate-binding protein